MGNILQKDLFAPIVRFFRLICECVLLIVLLFIDKISAGRAFSHLDVANDRSEEDIAFARAIDADFPRAPIIGDHKRISLLRKLK